MQKKEKIGKEKLSKKSKRKVAKGWKFLHIRRKVVMSKREKNIKRGFKTIKR